MPPIHDLNGIGRTHGGPTRIFGRAVPCHDLDLWVAPEPGRQRRGRTIRQQIDGTAAFEVDQDGAIGSALAQSPVVDTDDDRFGSGRQRTLADTPQQRRGTGGHRQVRQQPGGGCGTERQRGPNLSIDQPAGSLSVAVEEARQTLGKGSAGASRVVAVKTSDRQGQTHFLTARRQVGGTPVIATMHRPAARTTAWATGMIALRLSGNAKGSALLTRDVEKATTGDVTEKGHTLI